MVARPASLVLCDIRLPDHDGLWLAARLHARWPDTPFIMASAIDDVETIRHSRELGAVDYVSKPFVPEQLLAVIRRVTTASNDGRVISSTPPTERAVPQEDRTEAEYTLECPVRCPACGERIATMKAVRLVRTHVNFVSTLPRRGRVLACPHCLAVIPGELTNF
jgi:DNA-binding response OmpR family regulator